MTFRRLALALSGWVAVAVTALPPTAFPRMLVVTVFLFVCPGLAGVRWARPPGRVRDPYRVAALESWVLVLVLSLTLWVLVAEALLLAGVFTLVRALLVLATLTCALALVPRPEEHRVVRRSVRSRPGTAGKRR
jgi:hypothetical protein